MNFMRRFKVLLCLIVFGTIFISVGFVSAESSSPNISRSYKATGSVPIGSLVSLNKDRSDYVELASLENSSLLLGIAVATDGSLLAVNPSESTVQVATSGAANVLVSDFNGPINIGDKITVSPFRGIGMVQKSNGNIIGISLDNFDTESAGVSSQDITDKAGRTKTIHVGFIKVSIGAGVSTSTGKGVEEDQSSLQKIAKSLVGHRVATWRIVLSIIIVIVSLAALITLTYAAIYGSIISVGRNPLGSRAIFKTLRSVLGMALLTAFVAGIAIFFLLK